MKNTDNSINLLKFFYDSGVDEFLTDIPQDYFHFKVEKSPNVSGLQSATREMFKKESVVVADKPIQGAIESQKLCEGIANLDEFKTEIKKFDGCSLKKFAMSTIIGDGFENEPTVMCIGEAPNADEDRAGLPFAGNAGELLDKMLGAIGLSRKENTYVTNMINWRPPGNRAPTSEEVAICLPFIKKHIELIKPKVIVFFGGSAAQTLTGEKLGITRIHGKWLDYNGIPAMAIYHPTFLIKDPSKKKEAWEDLLKLKEKIEELNA